MGERLSQSERVAQSRERLLDAASELFIERGYQATTATDIAERAGYSREMVRVRFGSKLDLAMDLVEEEYQQPLRGVTDVDAPALDVLRARVNRLGELISNSPVRVRAAFVLGFESAVSLPELKDRFAEWIDRSEAGFVADLERAVDEGTVIDIDPKAIARLLVDTANGGAFAAMRSGDPAEAVASLHALIDLISAPSAATGSRQIGSSS